MQTASSHSVPKSGLADWANLQSTGKNQIRLQDPGRLEWDNAGD